MWAGDRGGCGGSQEARTCFIWGKFGRLWTAKPSPGDTGLVAIFSPTPPRCNARVAPHCSRFTTCFKDVAISPREDLLATVDNRGNVLVFHLSSNRYVRLGHAGPSGTCVRFSTSSTALLVSGHSDGRIRCFNASTSASVGVLTAHRTAIKWLDFKFGSHELVSTSQDCVVIWDMKSMTRVRTLGAGNNGTGGGYCAAKFLQGGCKLVTCCRDGGFLVWDSKRFTLLGRATPWDENTKFSAMRVHERVFCVSPDGKWLVCAGEHPGLLVCEIVSCSFCHGLRLGMRGGGGDVRGVEFMSDSKTVVVLGGDGGVKFVDLFSGCVGYNVLGQGKGKKVDRMAIGENAHLMAVVGGDGKMYLYDMGKVKTCHPDSAQERLERVIFKRSQDVEDFLRESGSGSGVCEDGNGSTELSVRQMDWTPDDTLREMTSRSWNLNSCAGNVKPLSKSRALDSSQLHVARLGAHDQQLNRKRLRVLLDSFGEYPEKYRLLVWEFLLEIPHNSCAFEILENRGPHPAFNSLKVKFPCLERVILDRLGKVLSNLAHWCPVLGEAAFLPSLVFPFVKLFGSNEEACFEIIITILFNWAETWFQQFPRPPMHVLQELETLVSYHDPQILDVLSAFTGGVGRVGWGLMSTLMSEVVSKQEWLQMWDHIVTNEPTFLHFLIVSHLMYFKQSLMAFQKDEDIEAFVHLPRPSDIRQIIKQAYSMHAATPVNMRPVSRKFRGIPSGNVYPDCIQYPRGEVEWLSQERSRIQSEEEALHRRRWILRELESQTLKLEAQRNHHWVETLQAKELAEQESQKQRDELRVQEQEIVAEKARLDDRVKQERIKQIAMMEDAFCGGIENMQDEMNRQTAIEAQEIAHKKEMLLQDLVAAKEDEKIKILEFQSEQRLLKLHNEKVKNAAKLRGESEARSRLAVAEANQKNQLEVWKAEDHEQEIRRKEQAAGRSEAAAVADENTARMCIEETVRKAELAQEAEMLKIANQRRVHQAALEEADKKQQVVDEERKRGDILAVQDQALLKAYAEEDKAWFEREKVIKEERMEAQKAARQQEKMERYKQQLEQERHSKLHEAEIDLISRRRKMERVLLAKEQEAQRLLKEVEDERRREKLADEESMQRQQELETRVKHAIEVSNLQVAIEEQERDNIAKDQRAADAARVQKEAAAQQKHHEIMGQLALERERQLLELDTAWRKQVRIEETARWEQQRIKSQAEELKVKSEHIESEQLAARDVAEIRRKAQLAKHRLDPKEPLLPSQLLSEGDTTSSSNMNDTNQAPTGLKASFNTSRNSAKDSNNLFSSGNTSCLDKVLAQVELTSDDSVTDQHSETNKTQSCETTQSIEGHVGNTVKEPMLQRSPNVERLRSWSPEAPVHGTSPVPTDEQDRSSTSQVDRTLPVLEASFESEHNNTLWSSWQVPARVDASISSQRDERCSDDSVDMSIQSKPIGSIYHQLHSTKVQDLLEATAFGSVSDTQVASDLPETQEETTSTATDLVQSTTGFTSSFLGNRPPPGALSAVPEEESASSASNNIVLNDPGLISLQATRSRISALLDEVLGTDSPETHRSNQKASFNDYKESDGQRDFDSMMKDLMVDVPSSPDTHHISNSGDEWDRQGAFHKNTIRHSRSQGSVASSTPAASMQSRPDVQITTESPKQGEENQSVSDGSKACDGGSSPISLTGHRGRSWFDFQLDTLSENSHGPTDYLNEPYVTMRSSDDDDHSCGGDSQDDLNSSPDSKDGKHNFYIPPSELATTHLPLLDAINSLQAACTQIPGGEQEEDGNQQ